MAAQSERYWANWTGQRRWRKLRRAHLAREPLCRECLKEGKVTPATDVDHVQPHRGDRDKFWNGAMQSLCKVHHGAKTALENGKRPKVKIEVDGAPKGW